MHYCYPKQVAQEYLTYHFANCMSHNARVLEKKIFTYLINMLYMTFSFYEQHQSIALQLKTYRRTGEGETKCCAKCSLEVYMTHFVSYERTSNSRKIGVNHFLYLL